MKHLADKRTFEYATALKEALVLRRTKHITPQLDDMLGVIAISLTKWSLIDKVSAGALTTNHLDDPDFFAQCVCSVVSYFDKVDLDRQPKEILLYLKSVAASSARDQVLKENTAKRKHDECDADGVIQLADFYGEPTGDLGFDYDTPKFN